MTTRLDLSKLSLMDALDLAAVIELEAFKRYTQFAEQFGSRATDDAGAVFQSMAVNENKHCEQLAERRIALFGDKPAKVTIDDIFDVEAPDFGAPRGNMSPLKAYRVALSSEKKAFAFYDQALRDIPDLEQKIAQGRLKPLREWLRSNVHELGRTLSAAELIEKISGEKLDPVFFLKYLETKFGNLYGI